MANLCAIALIARDTGSAIVGSPLLFALSSALAFVGQIIFATLLRSAVALARRDSAYFRIIRTRRWLLDSLRIAVAAGIMVTAYGWIKLVVPLYHPRLFDQELWDLDQTIFFGFAPALFFLNVFEGPMLRVIDISYAKIFYISGLIAFGYFASHPSRRLRVAFTNGNALLWISGAWLYMLVPSLGPALRFPQLWLEHAAFLPDSQAIQALLTRNYQNVLRAAAGQQVTSPVVFIFGIGAFPSIHVGLQFYVFLWMRRLWTSGEVLFGIFFVSILLGSMVTGWHYLVDGIAGVALAWLCHRIFWRRARIGRWVALRERPADRESG